MLLSIVTGTYNRLAILQKMMSSVRVQMYPGLSYEFVIVDGGSTDGTQAWLSQQPDVRLIEHGELRGAISAFCDGARAASGEYVVMANDDIEFGRHSILTALAHLEDNANCGAVAFADNRFRRNEHIVMHHPARDVTGAPTGSPYAQIGMFPRWLGDLAGWWGDKDHMIGQSRTYGGDNYLSARIWEMGFTIETCPACIATELMVHLNTSDSLREINARSGDQDSANYYGRFPHGPLFGSDPIDYPPGYPDRRLRVLYLPIYEGLHEEQRRQKRGLRKALAALGVVVEYDYMQAAMRKINIIEDIAHLSRMFRPHVLLTQFQDATGLLPVIQQARQAHPEMFCVNWNGDYWPDGALSEEMLAVQRWYDLSLVVNANTQAAYQKAGIPSAYWQVASEEPQELPDMPTHDIVFLANSYSGEREKMGEVLRALPYNVGLYGGGWSEGNGSTLYNYAASHALMANAVICIGDNQYNDGSAFVSNRFFETLHAGGFLLHQSVPNLYKLTGFRAGQHYGAFDSLDDLPDAIEYWMNNPKKREAIRKRGQKFVHSKHSFAARVEELFLKLIPELTRPNGNIPP